MFTPATLLQLKGNVNIKLKNLDYLEQHPKLVPFMATFDQVFE